VPNEIGSVAIAGTANHSGASVDGNGNTGINVGNNSFSVIVTAEDGVTKRTYTLNIIRVSSPTFVAVTDISDVPLSATAQMPLQLTGTVNPSNATNQTIVWSVRDAGTTDATISGNTLTATAAGTVTVTATIVNGAMATANYTQDFTIVVSPPTGNETIEVSALKAWSQAGTLYIKSEIAPVKMIQVFDISGQLLKAVTGGGAQLVIENLPRGQVLIIRIETDHEVVATKIKN
jgi:hypothetical protein